MNYVGVLVLSIVVRITICEVGKKNVANLISNSNLDKSSFFRHFDGANYIEDLSSGTLDTFFKRKSQTFIMFYASWCKESMNSRSGYAAAAKHFNQSVLFGCVDCEDISSVKICDELGIGEYPAFHLFQNGQVVQQYRGHRGKTDFVEWISSTSSMKSLNK